MSTSWRKSLSSSYVVAAVLPNGRKYRVKAPYSTQREQARRCAQTLRRLVRDGATLSRVE